MSVELDYALVSLEKARWPEDVFGKVSEPYDEYVDAARRIYRMLARVLHPDMVPDTHRPVAEAAFAKLSTLWEQLQKDHANGALGEVRIRSKTRVYRIGPLLARGDLCNVYRCSYDSEVAVLKMVRSPRNADLVKAEALALGKIARDAEDRFAPYFPTLLESFRYRDGSKDHAVNVLNHYGDDWYTLAEVAQAYPGGLDPRDAAWMWRRMLVALGAAHAAGVVHGAVLPEHVIVWPQEHGLVLLDWSYSVSAPDGRVSAVVPRYRDSYPAEVLDKKPVTPATDIYMAAGLFAGLIHPGSPRQIKAFFNGCRLPARSTRPDDAWALLKEYDELIVRLWGPRRFRVFSMPPRAA